MHTQQRSLTISFSGDGERKDSSVRPLHMIEPVFGQFMAGQMKHEVYALMTQTVSASLRGGSVDIPEGTVRHVQGVVPSERLVLAGGVYIPIWCCKLITVEEADQIRYADERKRIEKDIAMQKLIAQKQYDRESKDVNAG